MKQKPLILISVLAVILAVTAFAVGKASASTGCFNDTNGHWAETFICWLKDNSISSGYADGGYHPDSYITRAEMAVMLQNQAEVPPSTGDIYINAGLEGWDVNGNFVSTGYVGYFDTVTRLRATSAGTNIYQLTPDLPGALYGYETLLHGVKLCYDASATGAYISSVQLKHFSGGANPSLYHNVIDTTDRSDKICREYVMTIDGSVWGTDHVVVLVTVSFPSSSDYVDISATTFTLRPSIYAGVLEANEARPNSTGSQDSSDAAAP